MCIIQIGELVNRLSDECIEEYNRIPWHAIRGMRNLHAHDYENVDLEIVWNTLLEDIPYLKEQISNTEQVREWLFFHAIERGINLFNVPSI